AAEQLEKSGEGDKIRDAQCAYFADFVQKREPDVMGRRQLEALREIDLDFENIRMAWGWAIHQHIEDTIDRMLETIDFYHYARTIDEAGRELFDRARNAFPVEGIVQAHRVRGRLLLRHPNPPSDMKPRANLALSLARQHGDQTEVGISLM